MAKLEAALHRTVADYLRRALRPPTFFTTFPAGGGGRIRGALLKAAGLQAGAGDLLVIHPVLKMRNEQGAWVLWIELKTETGRQSPVQKDFERRIIEAGCFYHVARSVEDVEAILRETGIPVYGRAGRMAA